mmetsp:Transcript_39271/g.118117  ORF Transcript_39271/g.118117 Transcript_39271/m.118117 type:complete len:228 (+) Transcript_39271:1103-1786(+)
MMMKEKMQQNGDIGEVSSGICYKYCLRSKLTHPGISMGLVTTFELLQLMLYWLFSSQIFKYGLLSPVGSWDGTEWEVLMDEVKQRVAELSVESGHHMSKKAKKEQRATFREFMATIVDDESPSEIVSFRGGQLTLKSWREIIQLNFIRHCLQSGFQIQLMTNPTLHAIFGADGNLLSTIENMSQLEKRLTMSKTSQAAKAADVDLTRRRRNRTNMKNHFLTADGDDF